MRTAYKCGGLYAFFYIVLIRTLILEAVTIAFQNYFYCVCVKEKILLINSLDPLLSLYVFYILSSVLETMFLEMLCVSWYPETKIIKLNATPYWHEFALRKIAELAEA